MKVVACCCKGVVANVFIIEEEEHVDDVAETHIAIHFHYSLSYTKGKHKKKKNCKVLLFYL